MNFSKVVSVTVALPLMFVLFWQEGACQHGKKIKMTAKKINSLQTGTWGGKHVGLEVTTDGVTVEYDCGHGIIDRPIVLDENGRFEVKGTYVKERPGPVRIGQEDKGQPALYAGRIDGKTMILIVKLVNSDEVVGTFTVSHGETPRVTKCL